MLRFHRKQLVQLAVIPVLRESNIIYTEALSLPRTAPNAVSNTLSVAIASLNVATLCVRELS